MYLLEEIVGFHLRHCAWKETYSIKRNGKYTLVPASQMLGFTASLSLMSKQVEFLESL